MTVRTTPPFRADHVGSLLRPPGLLRAREDRAQGRISAAELRAIEDEAIRKVVKMQEDVGLRSATDGEFRRASWHMDFIYQVGGIEKTAGNMAVRFRNEKGVLEFTPAALHIGEKLRLDRTIFGDDFTFLKSVTKNRPKLTIPSPSMVHYRGGRAAIDQTIYPDLDAFWADLTTKLGIALRGDYIKDSDGAGTSGLLGFPANPGMDLLSATLTLNYHPVPNVKIQPEVRYDHTSLAGGFDGRRNRFVLGAGVSYLF